MATMVISNGVAMTKCHTKGIAVAKVSVAKELLWLKCHSKDIINKDVAMAKYYLAKGLQ